MHQRRQVGSTEEPGDLAGHSAPGTADRGGRGSRPCGSRTAPDCRGGRQSASRRARTTAASDAPPGCTVTVAERTRERLGEQVCRIVRQPFRDARRRQVGADRGAVARDDDLAPADARRPRAVLEATVDGAASGAANGVAVNSHTRRIVAAAAARRESRARLRRAAARADRAVDREQVEREPRTGPRAPLGVDLGVRDLAVAVGVDPLRSWNVGISAWSMTTSSAIAVGATRRPA